jgi:Archaeal fructose-1,6-bisphosphatase and related enzymes of inositol monophosphatase family
VSKRTQLKDCLVSTGFPFRLATTSAPTCACSAKSPSALLACVAPALLRWIWPTWQQALPMAFFETGLNIWDVAAGSLIVTEAGGLVGNFTGEADFLEQRECLAGNPRAYGQLVSILSKYSKFAGVEEKLGVDAGLAADKKEEDEDKQND